MGRETWIGVQVRSFNVFVEITLEAMRRGGLSKITVRNLCRCPQLEESLLIYLTCTLFDSTLPDRFLGCNWAKVENSMSLLLESAL